MALHARISPSIIVWCLLINLLCRHFLSLVGARREMVFIHQYNFFFLPDKHLHWTASGGLSNSCGARSCCPGARELLRWAIGVVYQQLNPSFLSCTVDKIFLVWRHWCRFLGCSSLYMKAKRYPKLMYPCIHLAPTRWHIEHIVDEWDTERQMNILYPDKRDRRRQLNTTYPPGTL